MQGVTDNVSIDDIVCHLVEVGISDNEVREAHYFAVEWLTFMATSQSRPEEASEAAAILQCCRRTPNPEPGEEPLMTDPHWTHHQERDASLNL